MRRRVHHRIWSRWRVAAAFDEVEVGETATVDEPNVVVDAHVLGADDRLKARTLIVAEAASWSAELGARNRWRRARWTDLLG